MQWAEERQRLHWPGTERCRCCHRGRNKGNGQFSGDGTPTESWWPCEGTFTHVIQWSPTNPTLIGVMSMPPFIHKPIRVYMGVITIIKALILNSFFRPLLHSQLKG